MTEFTPYEQQQIRDGLKTSHRVLIEPQPELYEWGERRVWDLRKTVDVKRRVVLQQRQEGLGATGMNKQICEAKDCEQECYGYTDLLCPFHQKRQYIIETKELCGEITRVDAENARLRKQVEQLSGFSSGLIHQLSLPLDGSVELRRRLAAILEGQTDE